MASSPLVAPWSAHLSLDDTVSRLHRNPRVRAIGYLGSTATPEWTDASDYDLCVLLNAYPPGCGVEASIVEGRIADVVIIDADRASAWARPRSSSEDPVSEREWPFVHWLSNLRVVFDPDGLGALARNGAARLAATEPATDAGWQQTTRSFVTHDLRVNSALLARVDDPTRRIALGLRQLNTFASAVQAWFTARDIRREGWKCDVATIERSDAAFLSIIEQWLAANDPATRHELHCRAVEHALQPIGGPLPAGKVLERSAHEWESLGLVEG